MIIPVFAPSHPDYSGMDSPKKQMYNGVAAQDVTCKPGLALMIRISGDAACVTPETSLKLSKAGWGKIVREAIPITEKLLNKTPLLTLVNYATYTEEPDGLAIIDLNPYSETYSEILQLVPIGRDVRPHHSFYTIDATKLYNTALSGDRLYEVILHDARIFEIMPIEVGQCIMGEDLYFSEDGKRLYQTCMGSDNIIVLDIASNKVIDELQATFPDEPYIKHPHGISADEKINRMLVTETVSPALDDPGSTVAEIEFDTGKVLSNIPLTKDSQNPSAPVEVLFHPNYSIAYVTGMLESSIWMLKWNPETESFETKLIDDGTERGHSWPLGIYPGPGDKLYVSWALPGVVTEYDLKDPENPRLARTIAADFGAHHILFSPDSKYMFVQNNLLNLEGMNSGTISVIDLKSGEKIDSIDTFVKEGMMPESFTFLDPRAFSDQPLVQIGT